MTTVSTFASSVDSQVVVPAELLDALVEAVVFSPDPRARSPIIGSVMHEICAAVEWLHVGDTTTFDDAAAVELASIGQLAAAAQDHHWRMSFLHAGAVRSDTR